jgi:hypothetical protein
MRADDMTDRDRSACAAATAPAGPQRVGGTQMGKGSL